MSSYGEGWSAWDMQTDARAQRVNDALKPVQVRSGMGAVNGVTPLMEVDAMEQAALGVDDGEDDDFERGRAEGYAEGRRAGARAFLEFCFKDGYHPGVSMRRLYGMAQKLSPDLIAQMSGADCGSMFGETRAAWDYRLLAMFDGTGVKGRDGKREGAKEKYRQAQMGNSNRKNGAKRSRQL